MVFELLILIYFYCFVTDNAKDNNINATRINFCFILTTPYTNILI